MIVAAVDSAELCGFAVVSRFPDGAERLLWHATTTIRTAADVTAAVHALVSWSPDVVAIEEPFAHPRSPIAGMALERLLGRWLQAFEEIARVGTVTIPASMWQPAVLPGFTPRMRSAERKVAAQSLALREFGISVGADAADAIGLALYTARNATIRHQEARS